MARKCAELIFVGGPQAGQRSALLTNPVLGGRSAECELHIAEEFVSRQAFQLTLTSQGWIVENLTKARMLVGGKKYRSGKRLLLETGDTIAVGAETVLLFVSTGDDAEEALAAWRAANTPPETPPPPGPAKQAPPEEAHAVAEPAARPDAKTARAIAAGIGGDGLAAGAEVAEKVDSEAARQKLEEREKAAKRKKYLVAFAIYAGVLAIGFAALMAFKPGKNGGNGTPSGPKELTYDDIRLAVKAGYDKPNDPDLAEQHLTDALWFWASRNSRLGNVYRAVKRFKLHLAYSDNTVPQMRGEYYENEYDEAVRTLKEDLGEYGNVLLHEKAGRWRGPGGAENLDRVLGDCDREDPEHVIRENLSEHMTYVRDRILARKQEKKKSPL